MVMGLGHAVQAQPTESAYAWQRGPLDAPLIVVLFLWNHSPMLLLLALLSIPHLLSTFRSSQTAMPARYYEVASSTRWSYATYYLLLAGFLGVMTYETHRAVGA